MKYKVKLRNDALPSITYSEKWIESDETPDRLLGHAHVVEILEVGEGEKEDPKKEKKEEVSKKATTKSSKKK